jgi:hypothetical protein
MADQSSQSIQASESIQASQTIHTITLMYDVAQQTVTTDAKSKSIQQGDALEFFCKAGDVRVLMIPPEKFAVAEYRSGDAPIVVGALERFKFCCGVNIDGVVIGYPEHQRFGDDVETGGGGSGTK